MSPHAFSARQMLCPGAAFTFIVLLVSGCGQPPSEELSAVDSGLMPATGEGNHAPAGPTLDKVAVATSPVPEQDEVSEATSPVSRQEDVVREDVVEADVGAAETDAAVADPYPVPTGGPEELIAFIDAMDQQEPEGQTRQEKFADYRQMIMARVKAAERLFREPDESLHLTAAGAKIESLQRLRYLGDPDAGDQLQAFYRELSDSKNEQLSLMGKMATFMEKSEQQLNDENGQPEVVLQGLREVLAAGPLSPQVLDVCSQVVEMLIGSRANDVAEQAIEAITQAFEGVEDDAVIGGMEQLARQMRQIRFERVMADAIGGQKGLETEIHDAVVGMFGGEFRGLLFNQLFKQGTQLERMGKLSMARSIVDALGVVGEQATDSDIREAVKQHLDYSRRRLGLIGEQFIVEGITTDGEPFEWSEYEGKIVLIDFWATNCGPCLHEIPNMVAAYEEFNDDGFEIVGINLDDSLDKVQNFLKNRELPWKTVVSPDVESRGFANPIADRCGVDAIPFLVLVGRDGKVIDLHTRGRKLQSRLQELFAASSSVETSDPNEDSESPSTTETSG